jgi:HEAT repeats
LKVWGIVAAVRREGTPRQRVEALAARRGNAFVVGSSIDLLGGREVDGSVIFILGGAPGRWAIDGGSPGPDYWLRVWALRALLWVWDDAATSALLAALADEAWRVREMAAKVAGRHVVDDALPLLIERRDDPVRRVRIAASRSVEKLTLAGE